MGLFDKLQYNFQPIDSSVIFEFSDEVKQTLETTPKFVPDWVYEDISNDEDTSYTVNPVANVVNNIISVCTSIYDNSSIASVELSGIMTVSTECVSNAGSFFNHTQRLSGFDEINSNTALLPHYDTAMAIGKSLTHLVYQSDGEANSAVILGSFTSILVEDELNVKYNTIIDYPNIIANSIYDSGGYHSNLSSDVINTIISDITDIKDFFYERQFHDENFYTQSQNVLTRYENSRRYTGMGESDSYIVKNFLATDKLKLRL